MPVRSGVIRQAIGPLNARLQSHFRSFHDIRSSPIPDNHSDCTVQIDDIIELRGKISGCVETLERKDEQWNDIILAIEDSIDLAEEERIYQMTAFETSGGFLNNVHEAKEVICSVDRRRCELQRVIDALHVNNQSDMSNSSKLHQTASVNLPKLTLPTFNGDHLEWIRFWSIYKVNIHDRNIAETEKFAYLSGLLVGPALNCIAGLSLTEDNYKVAIDILRGRYEKSATQLIGALYSRLKRIPVSSNSVKDLLDTYDSCEKIFRQLTAAGENIDENRSLVLETLSKYPAELIKDLMHKSSLGPESTLKNVRQSLHNHIIQHSNFEAILDDLEPFNKRSTSKRISVSEKSNEPSVKSDFLGATSALVTNSQPKPDYEPTNPCYFCSGRHFNSRCPKYKFADQRKRRLLEINRCTKCLSAKHVYEVCPMPPGRLRCFFCKTSGDHVSPLCPQQFRFNRTAEAAPSHISSSCSEQSATGASSTPALLNSTEKSFLMTATVTTRNSATGNIHRTRLIFDSGSHRSYVTESLADKLGLQSTEENSLQVAIFGTQRTLRVPSRLVNFDIQLRDGSWRPTDACTTPIITSCKILPANLSKPDVQSIQMMGLSIADANHGYRQAVDILIGADYFWEFIDGQQIPLPSGLRYVPSIVGGIIGGRTHSVNGETASCQPSLLCITETFNPSPIGCGLLVSSNVHCKDPDIDEFWKLETIGIMDDPIVVEDDIALQQFNETVYFDEGRYHVRWPWKGNSSRLPSNYELALGRFRSLTKRLAHGNPKILQAYAKVVDDQLLRGVIEPVPSSDLSFNESSQLVHYLPHHAILKPSSSTTKVRIVYDASAKTHKSNPSLNECLLRGPILLPDLCAVLIRFRLYRVALLADIEKAFLQLSLQPADRDVTRFFWFRDTSRPTIENNLCEFRFCRVPFGIISSPFLLNATIQYHLKKKRHWVPKNISDNIYVDNIITGVENSEDGMTFCLQAKVIFQEAGMHLQEWASNCKDAIDAIDEEDKTKQNEVKVLGMLWDRKMDDLRLRIRDFEPETKRQVLQCLASVYDPLGLYQPCLLRAKLFLQRLWERDKGWDEQLDGKLLHEWQELQYDFAPLSEIRVSRCPFPLTKTTSVSVVTFCDSSAVAYVAAVYLRVKDANDNFWSSNLFFSKSRLAPRKRNSEPVSLPRLELLGVLIGVRASKFVQKAIKISPEDAPVYVFTDSACVIQWLKTDKPLSVFVENRVKEIKSSGFEILYVRTDENPADIGTRGKPVRALCQTIWWNGPPWLKNHIDSWPSAEPRIMGDANITSEFKKTVPIFHTVLAGNLHESTAAMGILPSNFSSFSRLVRVTAWLLKFLKRLLWNRAVNSRYLLPRSTQQIFTLTADNCTLTPNDLKAATRVWILATQYNNYSEVWTAFRNGRPHGLIKQLGLYVDDAGILRCRGRLEHASCNFDAIEPILLFKNDIITTLLIRETHEKLLHAGVGHTLSQMRRTYWIPQGRAAVRTVLAQCVKCTRYKGPPYALPMMPPLPRERVVKSSPFQFTGLDYLGPINVRVEGSIKKMWVCIFTCLAVRAVHLEAVPDCTANEFLQCLIRFISRRGTPSQIISDNAPQFRVAKTVFDRVWHEIFVDASVKSYASQRGIVWKFTTELAPWQGGIYERMVGIVKGSFRVTIGRRLLPWGEFITLCAEVEAVANSRPITYVYSDYESGQCLRPIDFITDLPVGVPDTDPTVSIRGLGVATKDVVKAWKIKQGRLKMIWEFWANEYLLSLRERYQRMHRSPRSQSLSHPNAGDVVIVKDTDMPRGCWKTGVVKDTFISADNEVRSATVRLSNGATIKRPLNLLFPLELDPAKKVLDQRNSTDPVDEDDADGERFIGFTEEEVAAAVNRNLAYTQATDLTQHGSVDPTDF